LHEAADKIGLLITEGPHNDTQDLQVPAFRWMNRWLKGIDEPITDPAIAQFDPKQLKVFAKLPADQKNTTAHEWLVPKAEVTLPANKAEWEKQRKGLLAELKDKCFRNWPAEGAPLDAKIISEKVSDGKKVQVIEFTSEENLRLSVSVAWIAKQATVPHIALWVVKPGDWPEISGASPDEDGAFAVIWPQGEWSNTTDPKTDTHIRRRFVLLGRSLDDAKVWGVRRAIRALRARPEFKDAKITLSGRGEEAGIALYAGLFEPAVDQFDLLYAPVSHRDGPIFLNVLRVLDMPQAVALAFPRQVRFTNVDEKDWSWVAKVASLYDDPTSLKFWTVR
jgi:hypothetical protein